MDLSYRALSYGFMAFLLLAVPLSAAMADGKRSIAGDYLCESGCRMTDAPPGIEINGTKANCMNEFGGIYFGTVLTEESVACFNKVGRLSKDGKTIRWSDGVLWKRR